MRERVYLKIKKRKLVKFGVIDYNFISREGESYIDSI